MNPNLFKSTEFYQRRYHNFATLLVIPVVSLVIFLVIFSLVAKKEIVINSRGEVTPTKTISSIQSTSDNRIITNNLNRNQLVKKGELLIQYAEKMESSQKEALETQFSKFNRQKDNLILLKDSLEKGVNLLPENDEFGYVNTFNNFIQQSQDIELGIAKVNTEVSNQANLANNTISALDEQLNHMYQEIADYEELSEAIKNHTPNLSVGNPHQSILNSYFNQSQQDPNVFEQYIVQINQNITGLESAITNLNLQRAGTGSVAVYDNSLNTKIEVLRTQFLQTASQELTNLENQITELKFQLEQANSRLENNKITSPESGIIYLNHEFEGKSFIPNGNEIAQLYPDITDKKEVFITYYVTSEYISLLKKKQPIRFKLEKVGNQSTIIEGRIQYIDKTATKTDNGNLFKITGLAKLSNKQAYTVKYGLQGHVISIVAKKTYFDYFKDKLLVYYD